MNLCNIADYKNCLAQQLSELELLKSMYPGKGELVLSDENSIVEIRTFLDGKSEFIPTNLDFILKLDIADLKVEVCINLPSTYPTEEPDIYIRCNQLNRKEETNVNTELSSYIKENQTGEVCLFTAVFWLQENIEMFKLKQEDVQCETKGHVADKECFARYWVYSHHIYNKRKREDILKKAKELNITGFCLPGKPGVICIEGDESACKDWWKDIKSMTWKKITVRKMEVYESPDRKFGNFTELNNYTMKMFSKYMHDHGLTEIFNEIFDFAVPTE